MVSDIPVNSIGFGQKADDLTMIHIDTDLVTLACLGLATLRHSIETVGYRVLYPHLWTSLRARRYETVSLIIGTVDGANVALDMLLVNSVC